MIKRKYLAAFLIIAVFLGSFVFVGYAVSNSFSNSGTGEGLDYPDDLGAELIDDSDNEPVVVSRNEVRQKQEPGTEVDQEVLTDKLGIETIEKEYVYYLQDTTPDDPLYPQWYLTNLSAPTAWDITTGSSAVTVAVIDSGYALAHEDLVNAWAVNAGESGMTQDGDACWTGSPEDKTTNNCDDDGNSYVDDWRGWDFSNNDNTPQAGQDSSGSTHGTKVAGLVGARGNNATGVAALNWHTQIMPLQGLFDDGYGYTSDIVSAMIYAVDNGADVINMSLGSPFSDSAMLAAVEYAFDNNVIVVAAAGNCGADPTADDCLGSPNPGGMLYPGRFSHVISVGATTQPDGIASFSSFGPELDFAAPGHGTIQTTTWSSSNETSAYATSSYGTSFASPIVASLVALIKSEMPGASFGEVYNFLDHGADKVAAMGSNDRTDTFGHGRISANSSLLEMNQKIAALTKGSANVAPTSIAPTVSTNRGHIATNKIGSSAVITWCVTSPNTECTVTLSKQGSSTTAQLPTRRTDSQGIVFWTWNNSTVGSGTWDVTATANSQTSEKEVLFVQ